MELAGGGVCGSVLRSGNGGISFPGTTRSKLRWQRPPVVLPHPDVEDRDPLPFVNAEDLAQ